MRIYVILVLSLAFVGAVRAQCFTFTAGDYKSYQEPLYWYFGSNDGNGSTIYYQYIFTGKWTVGSDLYTYYDDNSLLFYTYPMINQAPLIGGKNMTNLDGTVQEGFISTANFTCLSDTSGVWGPSYVDFRMSDGDVRSHHPNLEVYVHYSTPNDTSYIRTIYFIKNTGSSTERVDLYIVANTNAYATDVSPFHGERYFTASSFEENDPGTGENWTPYTPGSIHVRGEKALDQTATVIGDLTNEVIGASYVTTLPAGEEFAFMHIQSFGYDVKTALKNAAEIDAEPEYIFHDLTSDQLAMIRNWGGCQAIIGPTATVTVTPPAQCSTTGLTSDFTVQASSTRDDLTTGFTHRVVGIQNIELVAAQSSTTLSVPNGAGAVRHQLWYKGCFVRETEFNACAFVAAPVSAPVVSTVPVASTPTTTKSDASSLAIVSVVSLIGVVALL